MPAVAACFAHAARIAGVHCAASLPLLAEATDMAWAEQPPSAGTAGVLFAATTVLPAVVASAFPDLWVSQASAAEAVQAGASSRSDFMDPTSRKVMAPRPLVRGARPTRLIKGNIGWPPKIVSPAHTAGVRHVQKAPQGCGRDRDRSVPNGLPHRASRAVIA